MLLDKVVFFAKERIFRYYSRGILTFLSSLNRGRKEAKKIDSFLKTEAATDTYPMKSVLKKKIFSKKAPLLCSFPVLALKNVKNIHQIGVSSFNKILITSLVF